MEFIMNTSFSIHHKMYDEQADLEAEAQHVLMMYNFNKNEKTAVTQVMRDAASELEVENCDKFLFTTKCISHRYTH